MKYDANNPTEYIKALESDWRLEKLKIIRNLIKKTDKRVKEVTRYKMLGYNIDGVHLCNLNAQSAYVALYVGDIKRLDPTGGLTSGLSCGKGCIRFKKSSSVSEKNIQKLISKAIKLIDQGEKINC